MQNKSRANLEIKAEQIWKEKRRRFEKKNSGNSKRNSEKIRKEKQSKFERKAEQI